ncbi:MAG: hypothetical protein HY430_02190 [Candidatus Levybacteria bacterium]|nr:hypothetical protein [Candidatus Levybacteria bacterium]
MARNLKELSPVEEENSFVPSTRPTGIPPLTFTVRTDHHPKNPFLNGEDLAVLPGEYTTNNRDFTERAGAKFSVAFLALEADCLSDRSDRTSPETSCSPQLPHQALTKIPEPSLPSPFPCSPIGGFLSRFNRDTKPPINVLTTEFSKCFCKAELRLCKEYKIQPAKKVEFVLIYKKAVYFK